MSVALITADWHFSDNPRDAYRFAWQEDLRAIVQEEGVGVVVVCGDLTEEKDRHSARLVNRVVENVVALSRLCPVVFLRGNHDATDPQEPFFGFLGNLPEVRWVNAPTKITTGALADAVGPTWLLPDPGDDYEAEWDPLDFSGCRYVFTHATFRGADVGHNTIMPGIPTDFFPADLRVISGDIHIPQKVDQVTYVGAPYTVDFGDDYQPRVLLLEAGKKPVSLRLDGPSKKLVEVRDGIIVNDGALRLQKGDIVKARVLLSAEEHSKWPEYQDAVRKWADQMGVRLEVIQPVREGGASEPSKPAKQRASRSDGELLREYAKRRGVDDDTLKTGINLMEKA